MKCKYCDYDYYVDSDFACQARTSAKTDNCALRKLDEDKCERC